LRVATPVESSGAEPNVVVPLVNVTVPVGMGPLTPRTVAARITCGEVPPVEEYPSAEAVGIVPTTSVTAGEVEPASFVSPE
jgi:hypothetical protein